MTLRILPFLVAALTACGDSQGDVAAAGTPGTSGARGPRPSPRSIAAQVDSLAARVVSEGLSPAFGVAVVMDGQTILAKSHGLADVTGAVSANDSTLWYVASTSKSFTGFGISLLAQQGIVDFDAPISTLLPQARWPRGYDPTKVTLADFLSHTHGLGDQAIVTSAAFTGEFPESQWPAMLRFAEILKSRELDYSNLGYNVAAMVIDAKRPEGWRAFLDSAVYRPAGMSDTYARVSGLSRARIALPHELRADGSYVTAPFFKTDATMNSAGGHLATMHDLARWVTVQMDGGRIDGRQVFPSEAVTLSHRMIARRKEPGTFAFFDREGWAAGWDIGAYHGEPMVSRFGSYSSTRSHLSFLPGRGIGVVTQANGDLGFGATDIIAAFAYDLERGDPDARARAEERWQSLIERRAEVLNEIKADEAKRAARQQPLKRPLSDFAGSYRHEWYGTIIFEVRGASLHYTWGALSGKAEVLDAKRNALRIVAGGGGNSVTFDFPRNGPATELELRGETFKRF